MNFHLTPTALLAIALALSTALNAAVLPDLQGRVVAVHDGDTITVLTAEKEQIKVRLEGIDAPELKQAFGTRAKQQLSSLVFNRQVAVKVTGHDRYRRTLGRIFCDAVDVNLELVKQGMAWRFDKYSKEVALGDAQAAARRAKRGLWTDTNPVPPWEWRETAKSTK